MNCPTCNQPVGHDRHHIGEWVQQRDADDLVIDCTRSVVIDCEHCGLFEAEQDSERRIKSVHGPYRNTRDVRRLAKHIPARKHDRRIPA